MIIIVEEMKKFRELLDQNKIEWIDDSEAMDTELYICRTHPKNHRRWSVVNGFGTYGGYSMWEKNEGLLEVMIDDKVIGHLNAEEAYMLVEAIEGSEKRTMARKFKNVTISQMMELRDKLSDKLAHGCSIEDALFYVQCYAAVDELLEIKEKGPLFDWTDTEGYKHPKSERTIIFLDRNLNTHVGYYCGKSKSWHCPASGMHVPDDRVIAWMEVPDYKCEK